MNVEQDLVTRKRRRLDTAEDREIWGRFYRTELFARGFGADDIEGIELKKSAATGAIMARVILDDGTCKVFSNIVDIATENYIEALARLDTLPTRNRVPEGLASKAFNIVRDMCPIPRADLKWKERGASVKEVEQRLLRAEPDRRKDTIVRAIKTLIRQGHLFYHPVTTVDDYVRPTEGDDDEGMFDETE